MCDRVSIIFPHSWFTMGVGLGDQLRVVVSVQSNVIRTFIKSTNTMFAFFWKKALKLNNNFTSSNLNMTQLWNICYILVYTYNFKISICMKQNIYLITFLEHFFLLAIVRPWPILFNNLFRPHSMVIQWSIEQCSFQKNWI